MSSRASEPEEQHRALPHPNTIVLPSGADDTETSVDLRLDPTRVSNQPALRTSRGTIWLVLGGLLAATALAELAFLVQTPARPIAVVGVVLEVAIYAGMILASITIPLRPHRLRVLAVGMIALAIVAIVALMLAAGLLTSLTPN